MASRSSARIKSRKCAGPPSSHSSNPSLSPKHAKTLPATKLRAMKMTPCVEGLDFVGHCPICLEKLHKTERIEAGHSDVPLGVTVVEGPGTPTVIPFSNFASVWQYLHRDKDIPLDPSVSTPKFTFQKAKSQTRLERSENGSVRRASYELSDFPTMCGTCHVEVLKLHKLHEELEAIGRALKSQVETIRKIVSCNISQRREFKKVLTSSCNRKGVPSKVIQFLEYIGNEVTSAPGSSGGNAIFARPRRKLLATEGDKNSISSHPVCTLRNDINDDKNLNSRAEREKDDVNASIPLIEGSEEYEYEVFNPVKHDPGIRTADQNNEHPDDGSPTDSSSGSDMEVNEKDFDDDDISDDDWEKKKTNVGRKTRNKTSKDVKKHATGACYSSTERQYRCTECDKRFRTLSALREHFFKFHTKGLDKGPAEVLKCDKCGKVFKYKPSLQFHKNFEDCTPNGKITLSWTCPFSPCDKTFSTRKELRLHKLTEHLREKLPAFRCEVCGKEFAHVGHFKNHMKAHNKGRPVCEICGLDFAKAKYLLKHMSVHSGEQPFCCELCGKQFRLAGFLREHKKNTHRDLFGTNKNDVTCDHCGKTFHTAKNLKEHMMLHTGAKPFVCEVCGKNFRIKRNLKSHMNYRHSKDKQTLNASKKAAIACEVCGKQYGNRRSLAGHVKLAHTDWTPFSCDECHLGFKTKYLLRDHQNMVHITNTIIAPSNSAEVDQSNEYLAPGPIITVEVSSSENIDDTTSQVSKLV